MDGSKTFDEVLDAVERLPADQQSELVEVVRRRLAERGRQQVVEDVKTARADSLRAHRIRRRSMTSWARSSHEAGAGPDNHVRPRRPAIPQEAPATADSLRATLEMLQEDAFDARLRTHKLKGDLEGSWASSGGYDLAIVFDRSSRTVRRSFSCCRLGPTTRSTELPLVKGRVGTVNAAYFL